MLSRSGAEHAAAAVLGEEERERARVRDRERERKNPFLPLSVSPSPRLSGHRAVPPPRIVLTSVYPVKGAPLLLSS